MHDADGWNRTDKLISRLIMWTVGEHDLRIVFLSTPFTMATHFFPETGLITRFVGTFKASVVLLTPITSVLPPQSC